jgi:CheY-like chemotaxis protein
MTAADRIDIFLVEDDDVDVMNVRRAFEKAKIDDALLVAHDGIEGLELLRRHCGKRRLVLLDLNLPRMDGIEMLRELRQDPELKETLVIVLTTSSEERDRAAAYDLNVAGYLLKPVTFGAFVDLMIALDRFWRLVEFPS